MWASGRLELLGALELLDGLGVVLELREDRRLVERQVTGDDPGAGLLLVGHGQGGVDLLAGERGPLGDLGGTDADERELLDAADDLAVAHRGAVEVLDHLVGDPVGLVGLGDDLRRDVGKADLGSDDGAPLATENDIRAVLVDVHGHRLQHAALLDRAGELLGVGVQVGADVRADLDLPRVQADELRVAHLGSLRWLVERSEGQRAGRSGPRALPCVRGCGRRSRKCLLCSASSLLPSVQRPHCVHGVWHPTRVTVRQPVSGSVSLGLKALLL